MNIARMTAIAVMAAGLAFSQARAADTVNLTLGHVAPPQTTYQQAAVRFADNLKELSGGTMTVDIVPGGALGSPPEMWVQTRTNTLDIHLIDIGAIIMMKEGAPFLVTWAPYLFKDQAQFHRFLESDLFDEMMAKVEAETGVVYAGFVGDRPPRAVTTRETPVTVPDDLKGLKIRTPGHPFIIKAFESWGATPTPLKASELILALKSGLVDGQDNGIIDFVGAGYAEAQKQYTPIDYLRSGVGVWFSPQAWANLTDQQKGWVKQAATKAGEDGKAIYDQQMKEAYAELDGLGVTLNKPDIAAFQAAVSGMIEGLDGKAWPAGLYEQIHGMQRHGALGSILFSGNRIKIPWRPENRLQIDEKDYRSMGVRHLAARIRGFLFVTLSAVAAGILIAMTSLEIVQVFLRYFAGSGFIWTGDVSVLLMQSLAWVAAPALWLCRGHIAVELIGPPRETGADNRMAGFLDTLIVVAASALLWYGQDALAAFANIDVPSLGTSGAIKYYPMMAGAALLLASGLLNLAAGERDIPHTGAAP